MSEDAVAEAIDPIPDATPDTGLDSAKKTADSDEPTAGTEFTHFANTRHKVKSGDQEIEIGYDDLISGYQKAQASDKKFREASEIRKKVDELLGTLKEGSHKDLVKVLGKEKARQVAQDLLMEEIEYEELPDHEKTIRQLEAEKREAEEKLERQETERETVRRQALQQQYAQELEAEMVSAVKASNAKVTPRLIARVAEMMEASFRSTGEKLPATQALEYVRAEIPKDFVAYVSGLSKDQVLALKKELPKGFLDVLRKDDVDAVLSQTPFGASEGRTAEKDPSSKKRKTNNRRMTTDAWFDKMEKRLGG